MNEKPTQAPKRPLGLLEAMRQRMRLEHLSLFTEQNFILWARRFIAFHRGRHPRQLSGPEIAQFLTHLPVERKIVNSTVFMKARLSYRIRVS